MLTALTQGGGVQNYGKHTDIILERSLLLNIPPNWMFLTPSLSCGGVVETIISAQESAEPLQKILLTS